MAPRVTDPVLSLMAFLWFTSILLFRVSAQSNGNATFYTPPYKRKAFVVFVPTVKVSCATGLMWEGALFYVLKKCSLRLLWIWRSRGDDSSSQRSNLERWCCLWPVLPSHVPQRDEPRHPKALPWKRFSGGEDCGSLPCQCVPRNYWFVTRGICIYSWYKLRSY